MKEKIIKIMLGWVENNEPIETTADKLLDLFTVSSVLYEFTMTNKNGKVTKSTIPCDDWLGANRVKTELMKSKNLIKVDFKKV